MELRRTMADKTREVILWRTEHSLLTLQDLASAAGLHPELVEKFIEYGLIEPSKSAGSNPLFSFSSVERLRRIMRLRRDLGVNLAAVGVILEMRERMENLQRELEDLRKRFRLAE
jgi:MerR family transcriptional regulator, heat shock protein HspR